MKSGTSTSSLLYSSATYLGLFFLCFCRMVSRFILRADTGLVKRDLDAWPLPKLQAYISHVKSFQPALTPPAEQVLLAYYQMQRQADARNAARTTIRMLESLIRLSQAHARLMYRKQCLVVDAVLAVVMVESSMQASALLGAFSALHTSFPRDPLEEYTRQGMQTGFKIYLFFGYFPSRTTRADKTWARAFDRIVCHGNIGSGYHHSAFTAAATAGAACSSHANIVIAWGSRTTAAASIHIASCRSSITATGIHTGHRSVRLVPATTAATATARTNRAFVVPRPEPRGDSSSSVWCNPIDGRYQRR